MYKDKAGSGLLYFFRRDLFYRYGKQDRFSLKAETLSSPAFPCFL
ncbi:hypothetical protein BN1184_CA_00040 [Pantoea ananatis]|jgi:hypothetical protein|nr:hypothetical protein BN1183_CP_00040 [Pantoea ananatis]CRH40491.1 hypothetical protein BN1184_CA_00040 [Pantoea ananatis]